MRPGVDTFANVFKAFDKDHFCQLAAANDKDPSWALTFNWQPEVEWLAEMTQKICSPLVLCTNDLNHMNILVRDEPDAFGELVTIIDYELSALNHRGYDIGYYFIMHCIDVANDTMLSGLPYPSLEVRREFCETYLKEMRKLQKTSINEKITQQLRNNNKVDTVDHMLMESEFHAMIAALWVVVFVMKKREENDPELMIMSRLMVSV